MLTGDRPTGPLHLGHYVGSLKKRVELSESGDYESYVMVADVQALTDNFENPEEVSKNTFQVLSDNLAAGVDPSNVTFFLQSAIPEIAELTVFFANLVTTARLERNPTVKGEIKQKDQFSKSVPLGFFMYPVSQAADILVVKAETIPVGADQLPHIEQTREIARRFNAIYGDVFPEPSASVSEFPRLVGLDGNAKMSKSLGNCIYLNDDAGTVKKKIMSMYTDPNRIHPTDPGKVEGNPVFDYNDAFNLNEKEVNDLKRRYREGSVGDIEVKEKLAVAINEFLEPVRQRRSKFIQADLEKILKDGTAKTKKIAAETMSDVRKAMKLVSF